MRKPLDIEKIKEVLASEEIRKDASPAVMALTGIVFALLEEIVELRKENEELRRENEALRAENTMLKEKVRELEIRLNKDSSNSGKPPSSDGLKKPPAQRSLRERSGRRPGGQPGRKGITLQFSENPDRIIEHPVETCNQCGLSLKDTAPDKIERRQVFDIPPMKLEVSEHRGDVKTCPCCEACNRAVFPAEAPASLQYGAGVKSLVTMMMNYQFIPFARLSDFFGDIFGQNVSPGTFSGILEQCYKNLEDFETVVKSELQKADVVGFDETGLRVEGKNHWLHSASNWNLTYYFLHEKRGKLGMDAAGILPDFHGISVHDGFKAYFKYSGSHSLCNAHHLRELNGAAEEGKKWTEPFKSLLLEIKTAVDSAKKSGETNLEPQIARGFEARYEAILKSGYDEYPLELTDPPPGKGKKKKPPSLNLLDRLWYQIESVLFFMHDFRVPFDNNQSERDIRMMKVKQKISGSFRSDKGAFWFARIRSYISTVRKNGKNILESINQAFQGKPYIPQFG